MYRSTSILNKIVVAIFTILLISSSAHAGSVPNTFTAGTAAKASEVNANFAYLQTMINNLANQVVPAGTVVAFAGVTPPTGWLFCDGSPVSRSTYSTLYAVIGSIHGSGDNVSTFNLPDYRGRFLRGVDGSAGRDPDTTSRTAMNTGGNTGNAVGSVQGDAFASHNHPYPGGLWKDSVYRGPYSEGGLNNTTQRADTAYTDSNGGSETRPVNAYVNYIIKY